LDVGVSYLHIKRTLLSGSHKYKYRGLATFTKRYKYLETKTEAIFLE
jgi:hypothetical protein